MFFSCLLKVYITFVCRLFLARVYLFGKASYLWMNQSLTYLGLVGEEFNPKTILLTVKHRGGRIIVWGYFAVSGMENIVFIENNMNQYKYINILKENLKTSFQKLGVQTASR